MPSLIKIFTVTLPIFFAIDMVWLGLIAKKFYANQIGFLLAPSVNWWSAIAFYLIFIFGLSIFVIQPALVANSLKQAFLMGALFGFISYATYDLTNLATIKDWPLLVTIVDLIWGTVLGGVVCALSFLALSFLKS